MIEAGASTLRHALAYIERGWSIIPLAERSKAPAAGFKIAPYLSGEYRMDLHDNLPGWWGSDAVCGIGIITGRPSGIVVVDVDPRNGGENATTTARCPSGVAVTTGSGGLHLYCRHPGDRDIRCGRTSAPGVDRKGDGGYVVAPPSTHPDTGDAYRWLCDTGTLLDLPSWVLDAPVSHSRPHGMESGPWVAEALANPALVLPGAQEETLSRLCWYAATHFESDIAAGLLENWVAQLPLGNKHDPWTARHVEERLERAYAKAESQPKVFQATADSAGGGTPDGTDAPSLTEQLRERVKTPAAYALEYQERQDWLVQDFLAPGCFTEVIGIMKEGKTTWAYGMLRAVTMGEPWLERPTARVKTLIVSEQVGPSLKASLSRAGLQDEDEHVYVLTISDLFGLPWQEAGEAIVQIAQEKGCGLIVVDTLARLAGVADEDEASSVRCLDPFLHARAAGIAVLFLRHGRKSGGEVNVAGRGSGAITGEMDCAIQILAPDGVNSDTRQLRWISRMSEAGDLMLQYVQGTYELGPSRAERRAASKYAPLLDVLSAQAHGATLPELIESSGKSRSTLQRWLTHLLEVGTIRQTGEVYALAPAPFNAEVE